jgi:hypothetical protein
LKNVEDQDLKNEQKYWEFSIRKGEKRGRREGPREKVRKDRQAWLVALNHTEHMSGPIVCMGTVSIVTIKAGWYKKLTMWESQVLSWH